MTAARCVRLQWSDVKSETELNNKRGRRVPPVEASHPRRRKWPGRCKASSFGATHSRQPAAVQKQSAAPDEKVQTQSAACEVKPRTHVNQVGKKGENT